MEIGSISLGLLISVPIIVIRINLPVADLENETFVWLVVILFHILNPCDTLWLLFMFAFTSVQLYRHCLHAEESLSVSPYRACFYPRKYNCENDDNNTHGTLHCCLLFSTYFTLPPSGALDKMNNQQNKFFTLHPGSVLFQHLRWVVQSFTLACWESWKLLKTCILLFIMHCIQIMINHCMSICNLHNIQHT